MENGRGWGEWAEVLEISKYMALRLSSHPKHEPHQLQETNLEPGVSWSISVLPDCGLNVTFCHGNLHSKLSMCFDSFKVFLIVQI